MNPGRREALLRTKLRVLASTLPGWDERAIDRPFPAGAAMLVGTTGFLLVDESRIDRDPTEPASTRESPRGWLGGAVVWAKRNGAEKVHVLLDVVDGTDARRAALFRLQPRLWRILDRTLVPVEADPPFVEPQPPPIDTLAFAGIIEAAGADAVVENGELRAEVLGLEVGRVHIDPEVGPVLEVGVGRHDRLANAMLHPGTDSQEVLRQAAEVVRARRVGPGSSSWALHPANQLQRERWLRAVICAHPDRADLDALATPLQSVCGTRETALKRPGPAMALGRRSGTDGPHAGAIVVACTVGIDLDAVPDAADSRLSHAPGAELIICVPEGDDHPALRDLAASLSDPATVRTVTSAWQDLSVS